MPTWVRLCAALILLNFSSGHAFGQAEQRVALVIGNGNYTTVGKLKNPANDAKAMAAMLRRAGFDVVEVEDATRYAMVQAVRKFAGMLTPGGVGLFFYAGHGIQAQGINYLVPLDATLAVEDDLKYEAMNVQDVLEKLDDARVRLSLVILDACRDNPFAKSFRSNTRGLAKIIDPPRGTFIAYSTAPGKVAQDGDGANSIYTTELLKAMSEPGIKLQDVFAHVTDAVELATKQEQSPWTNSSFRGDFYFLGPTTVTVTPPSAEPGVSAEVLEHDAWTVVANSRTPAPFEAFLKQFPNGIFAGIARAKIEDMKAAKQSPAAAPGGPQPSTRPPEIVLQEGNAALARRDYAVAEDAARDVIRATRSSAQGYDARLLLAQALSGENQYAQAAIAFDDAWNQSRKGIHAQDALLGLAGSLIAINEKKAACDTLIRLRSDFPQPRPDVAAGAAAAGQTAGCPPASTGPGFDPTTPPNSGGRHDAPSGSYAPIPRSYLVFFDWAKGDITYRGAQIVEAAADNSNKLRYGIIEVNGYDDTSQTAIEAQEISIKRAQAVAAILENAGVPRASIQTNGFGQTQLLVETPPGVREP